AGCPVITSNTTSMPEVGGDAALYCDPYLPQSIADAMEKIWLSP
ncbi:MAG TPA: glycosyltransferase family 1 protein, partial [Bacteroidales bacterium]|nr:glycosyltransferase family 1 protein [Bacteroidales bacterium]